MTPEEIAKLAEKLATDIAWDYIDLGDDPDYRADAFRIRIAEELTAHLAARETDTEQLAREDDIVEMEDERAFCIIILRLLGVDETDEYAKRIAPTVHELFRSRRAWRDLAKSLTREKHYLAAQAAELERLRERCEAATFIRCGNVSFQKSLMSGKWIVFRDHHEVTEYLAGDGRESFGNAYADTIDAGWLRDSNNKGGGYRESALTPQQEPGK